MNNTPAQLRLAADILETGHPWETCNGETWWKPESSASPAVHVVNGQQIRPTLATPPYPAQLHNPDNLTAEQVGVGYRLTVEGESPHGDAERWEEDEGVWESRGTFTGAKYNSVDTYRLPLSVPWPESADPYAELKAAHAAGKTIQVRVSEEVWEKRSNPVWDSPVEAYRIKPEPAFQLPPCAPGMRWHREDGWKADDLPQGYRPLVDGELVAKRDECCHVHPSAYWGGCLGYDGKPASVSNKHPRRDENFGVYRARTTRPLTFEHAGKTWTWHKPGDPMPCDGERVLQILLSNGEANGDFARAKFWDWKSEDEESDVEIIGWRYADEKKTVPLGREDIRCGDEVQILQGDRRAILRVTDKAVEIHGLGRVSFFELQICKARIRRRGSDAWEPCSKQIPA